MRKNKPFLGKNATIQKIIRLQEKAAVKNDWAFVDFHNPVLEVNRDFNKRKIRGLP